MHKEYAIDPKLLNSFDRIRALLDGCSWHTGKIVCDQPKKEWKKKVYESVNQNQLIGVVEKHRITEYLSNYSTCRRKNTANLGPALSWLEATKSEHIRKLFAAILSDIKDANNQVIDGQFITVGDEVWATPKGIIPRTPDDFAKAISVLAQNSHHFVFVDPYFNCYEPRFLNTFCKMVFSALEENYKRSASELKFELHFKKKESDLASAQLRRGVEYQLPQHIPKGIEIRIHIWAEFDQPEDRLHNRFFLTDLGGIAFGIGLDTTTNGPTQNDEIFILTKEQHQRNLKLYNANSASFKLLEDFTIKGK